ncbi:Gx transporter family protein [bacterium]|nr:Gx transporter family protein [bacterium]
MASVESLIQAPVPFMRLGLANGITLLVLKWAGFRQGVFVTIVRVVLAGLITGRIFQPAFFLSLSGGLIATLVMAAMLKWADQWFSLIGISIMGSVFHNFAQVIIASLLIHQFIGASILPVLFILSLITGMTIGYFALLVDGGLNKSPKYMV